MKQIDAAANAKPLTEADRLRDLLDLQLVEADSEPELDNLLLLASDVCDTPVAFVSFVGEDQLWFKSRVGLEATQAPRAHSLCSHVVKSGTPLVVEDASKDPRFQNHALVRAPQGVRFYAGIALVLSTGAVVGSLCVADHQVRGLSDKQRSSLQGLAGLVVALIEARRTRLQLHQMEISRLVSEQRLAFALEAADIGDWDMDLRTNVARRSLKHDQAFGYTEAVPEWGYDTFLAHIHPDDRARVDACYQQAMAGQGAYDVEFRVVWPDQTLHWLWSKGRFYFDEHGTPERVAGIEVDITERKQSEEALRASEYRWRFAIEGAGDGLWDWDIQKNKVFFNARWSAILGIAQQDMGSDPGVWEKHLHPEDKDRVFADVQQHLDGQTPHFSNEHRVIRADGITRWVLGRGLVVERDQAGKPLRMIGTNSDITDRKLVEFSLQYSNAQRKLLETSIARLNDIVLITEAEPFDDRGPRIVFVNDAFVRRTGYSREEVMGRTPRILQGPKTQRKELDRIRTALQRWEPVRAELINYTKAGEEFWLELDIVPVANASGWFTHWVAVERDITERKLAESALRESEARRKIATDSGRVAIWETNLKTDRVIWDDNFFALYRMRKEDFKGSFAEWERVIHPEDRAAEKATFQAAVAGTAGYDLTFRIIWPDGSIRFIQAHGEVVFGEDGVAERIVGTNWDVTEQKRYAQQLQALVSDKNALLKEVHHRVKNNLQVITSLLRLEVARSVSADSRAVLADMKGRIFAMAKLHESLYRSGTFAEVDLGSYLGQLAAQSFRSSVSHGKSVRLVLDLDALLLGMDQASAAGLLLNELISNCLKHGFPDGRAGEVRVALKPVASPGHAAPDMWCLRVSDTGVGLPLDFEARRMAALGMQLVGDLSGQLGGSLQMDTPAGGGTSFSVVFAAQAPAPLVMPV